jgi:hypothetical protein
MTSISKEGKDKITIWNNYHPRKLSWHECNHCQYQKEAMQLGLIYPNNRQWHYTI